MSRGEKSYKLESKNPSLLARVGGGFNEPTTFAATLINTRRIPYSPIHAVHPDRYYKAIRGESHGTRFLSTVNGNRLTSGNRRQKLVNAHAFPLINSTRILCLVFSRPILRTIPLSNHEINSRFLLLFFFPFDDM